MRVWSVSRRVVERLCWSEGELEGEVLLRMWPERHRSEGEDEGRRCHMPKVRP